MLQSQKERNKRAVERLKIQLNSNEKTMKGSFVEKEKLSEKDIERINKELEVLSKRV